MRITHRLPRLRLNRDDCSASDFILTDNIGGFISLSQFPNSKHNGMFFSDGNDIFKVLEYIFPLDAGPVDSIENGLDSIRRTRGDVAETFQMRPGCSGLIYRLNRKAWIGIDLDCRTVADFRKQGRYYHVSTNSDHITVHFCKKTDREEDTTHGVDEYELFIVLRPKSCDLIEGYRFINEWAEFYYRLDDSRGDDCRRYVYRPFAVETKEILIGVGKTKDEALESAKKLSVNAPAEHTRMMLAKQEKEVSAAFLCAQDSLGKLRVHTPSGDRTIAGLPWFYQYWTRDEAVSLGATIRTGQWSTAKSVLMQYIRCICDDGRIPNRVPSSDLGSADGVGWVFKRIDDLVMLSEKGIEVFDKKELALVKKALILSIERVEEKYMESGLIHNRPLETWMDTAVSGDDRSGFRLEIQAFHLNMLRLAYRLTGKEDYSKKEKTMQAEVMAGFLHDDILSDGLNDPTVRPNVFLAYYIYPDLLSRKRWEKVFDTCLERLWLEWGGLASIDKDHELMRWDYTGLDNRSYHHGDSWYWVNNLAAICLLHNNAIRFESQIQKILAASAAEILWSGAVGHSAEVSSASHMSSSGCLAQAWSDAMFIELVLEAFR